MQFLSILLVLFSFRVFGAEDTRVDIPSGNIGNSSGEIEENYVPLGANYLPNYSSAGVDFLESSLNGVGYPSDLDLLGSTRGTEFGKRCDSLINDGVKQIQEWSSFWNAGQISEMYGAMGFANKDAFEDACGANGVNCVCGSGLKCQDDEQLNKMIGSVEFQDRVGKTCLFLRTCQRSSHVSPFQACYNSKFSQCENDRNNDGDGFTAAERAICEGEARGQCPTATYPDRCYYSDVCLNIPPSKSEIQEGSFGEEPKECEHDFNCSSGYCKSFTNSQKQLLFGDDAPSYNKMCALPAECRPACTKRDEYLASPTENFCCQDSIAYTESSGRVKCVDPAKAITFGPPMFKVEVSPENCFGFVYEEIDQTNALNSDDASALPDDYSTWESYDKALLTEAKAKKNYRMLRALEFLWSSNPTSSGDRYYDSFKILKDANEVAKSIRDGHQYSDEIFLKAVRRLEKSKVAGESEEGTGANASAENAAGVSTINAMKQFNDDLATYYNSQANLYYDLLGFNYDPMTYAMNTDTSGDASADTGTLQEAFEKLREKNYSSNWPTAKFSRKSLAGLYYKMRFPKAAGHTGNYTQYGTSNDFGNIFNRRNLPCKNQEGDWIKAKKSDWFGDMKNNSVCVKEMSKVKLPGNKWVELVDPIYPAGLMGTDNNPSKYAVKPKKFPNVRRFRIEAGTLSDSNNPFSNYTTDSLRQNIKTQYEAYAREEWTAASCVKQKRNMDKISDGELALIAALSDNEKFSGKSLEEAKAVAIGLFGEEQWRERLAEQLTEKFIYEALVGVHQQKFVKDGFTVGGVLGWIAIGLIVLTGLALFGGAGLVAVMMALGSTTVVGVAMLVGAVAVGSGFVGLGIGLGTSNNGDIELNSAAFIKHLYDYEFEPLTIDSNFPFTGSSNRQKRKYLNSVSYKSEINRYALEPYLNMSFYLESYNRARQLYHLEVAQCLGGKMENYKESYGATEGAMTMDATPTLSAAERAAAMEDCQLDGSYGGGPGAGTIGITSEDATLTNKNYDNVNYDNNKNAGKGLGQTQMPIDPNLGMNGAGLSGVNASDSRASTSGDSLSSSELRNNLNRRNAAVKKMRQAHKEMLKGFGVKKALVSEGLVVGTGKHRIRNDFRGTPAGGALIAKLNTEVSTSAIREKKPKEKKKEILKKAKEVIGVDAPKKGRRSITFGGGGNSNASLSRDQENLLDAVKRNKSRLKKEEGDSLWETVTKTYLRVGIPKLFEKKKD